MTSTLALNSAPPRFPDLLRNWRKSRKLSQTNLALEAGVSQRHLSFLESGRSAPSKEMVLQLATSLALPLREKNALLNAAGFANLYGHNHIDQQELAQAKFALDIILKHHEPYPAVAIDRNWNLLMMNDANVKVFGHFIDPVQVWEDLGGHSPNVLRLVLHPKGLRQYLSEWHELALYFIHSLETDLSINPYNLEARELLNEIRAYPSMPSVLEAPKAFRPYLEVKAKKDDVELSFFTVISTFGTPQDVTLQELRIETFFPADEATESFVRTHALQHRRSSR